MKTPQLSLLLAGVLLLGGSLATNAWQWHRYNVVRHYADETFANLEDLHKSTEKSRDDFDQLKTQWDVVLKTNADALAHATTEIERLQQRNESLVSYNDTLKRYYETTKDLVAAQIGPQPTLPAVSQPASRPRPIRRIVAGDEPAAIPTAAIEDAVKHRAERFYKTQKTNGSGSSLVFDVDTELDPIREVPGWSGTYEVTGLCTYQYYDSIWGGSFSAAHERFSARVEARGGAVKIVDFSRKF